MTTATLPRLHALTIDVEDYFHVTAFANCVRRDQWDSYPSRVVANTQRLLDLFASHNTQATFFVLGWVAQRFPKLVSDIVAAGHEIGSHSYWHERIYLQTPDEFRDDLRRSREAIASACGVSVVLYRAPTFSITRQSLWALDILREEGFELDASIFPIRHDRYGIPDAPAHLHRVSTTHGELWEFPPSVAQVGRWRVPVGGGGYFRMFPWSWTHWGLQRCEQASSHPLMFYLHPWEIDPQQPHIAGAGRLAQFRHRQNLHTTERKLHLLLKAFRFGRICDIVTDLPCNPVLAPATNLPCRAISSS